MNQRELLLIIAAAAVAYLAIKRLGGALADGVESAANQYFSGVVRNTDGSINVGATVGIVNPSGIPAASAEQATAARLAVRYGVDIVYGYDLFGDGRKIDEAATLRDIAWKLGLDPVYTWYGAVDVPATIQFLNSR